MSSSRPVPKIALGQLPPPNAKKDKPSSSIGNGFVSPLTSPKKVKLNMPGIEESDSESSDSEMIIVEESKLNTAFINSSVNDNDDSMIIEEAKPINIPQGQKRKSKEDLSDPFDFNETDSDSKIDSKAKRLRSEFSLLRHKESKSKISELLAAKGNTPQPKYRPTWNDDNVDDEEEEFKTTTRTATAEYKSSNTSKQSTIFGRHASAPTLQSRPTPFSAERSSLMKVNQAQACLKRGEQEDFTQDFDYFMTVMETKGAPENTVFLRFVMQIHKIV
jgi:hypothetical protein